MSASFIDKQAHLVKEQLASVFMTKKEIRKIELQKRIQLTAQELENKTAEIIFQFNNLTLPTVNYLLSYHPLKEHNEFNVATCEEVIREKYPALNIAWPRILFNTLAMEAVLTEKDKLFIKNKYNILEPLDGTFVSPAFDRHCFCSFGCIR